MEFQRHKPGALLDVTVRSLQESELDIADRIFRVAFGTFLGLPNPETFAGDSDVLRTRWKADPARVLLPRLMASWPGPMSPATGEAWGSSARSRSVLICGIRESPNVSWSLSWKSFPSGESGTPASLPSHTARNTSICMRSLASARDSSRRSCQRRSHRKPALRHIGQGTLISRRASKEHMWLLAAN